MPAPQTLTPIATQPLSVVLLARNASAHVESLIASWIAYLDSRGQEYDLIVVDDGSSDGTADRARAIAANQPRLLVLSHARPQGEGAALRTALTEAKRPLLFCSLLEPGYKPDHLGQLLDKPTFMPGKGKEIDHVHLMSGYRAAVPVPLGLRVLGWLWRVLCRVVFSYSPTPLPGWLGWRRHAGWLAARILFALRTHDVACPVRLFRREIFARIPIQSDSTFAHVEILAKANFLGHQTVEEVPLAIAPPAHGEDFRRVWRDGKRLVKHPDFGPPVLPVFP